MLTVEECKSTKIRGRVISIFVKILLFVLVFQKTMLSVSANIPDIGNFLNDRKLIGSAGHFALKKKVYQASLYCGYEGDGNTEPRECLSNLDQEIVMKLVFSKKISARGLWTLWQNGLLRNSSADDIEKQAGNIPKLEKIIFRNVREPKNLQALRNSKDAKVKKLANSIIELSYSSNNYYEQGDQVVFYYHPKNGISFYWNAQKIGRVDDNALMLMLLYVWIGDRPPSANFKNAILGQDTATLSAVNVNNLIGLDPEKVKKAKSVLALEKSILALSYQLKEANESALARLLAREKAKKNKLKIEKIRQSRQATQKAVEAKKAAELVKLQQIEQEKELQALAIQKDIEARHVKQLRKELLGQFSKKSVQNRLRIRKKFGIVGFSVRVNRDGQIGNVSIEEREGYADFSSSEKANQDKLNKLITDIVGNFSSLKAMPRDLEALTVKVVVWLNLKMEEDE